MPSKSSIYQKRHREKYPEKVAERRVQYRLNNPERHLWYHAKNRAKRFGLELNIEVSDIIIPDVCPILDIPITKGEGKAHDNSPSLDRIDPRLGYIKGNISVISYKANRYKSDMTIDTLQKLMVYMQKQR